MDAPKAENKQRALDQTDLEKIAAGFYVAYEPMPDRTEQCGTMWKLQEWFRRTTFGR